MAKKRRTPARPTVVLDFGGVLSAGHDPVPAVHELLGGDAAAVAAALWEHRADYDRGTADAATYWGSLARAAGIEQLTGAEVAELQDADNRYFLHLDPEARALLLEVLAHENGGVSRPGDAIFFDDREDNVAAARALGIDAHLWPRNGDAHHEGTEHGALQARRVLAGRGLTLD